MMIGSRRMILAIGHRIPMRRGQTSLSDIIRRAFSKKRFVNVVLLEDLSVRGFTGEEVSVKPGYARNCLIPSQKAVYATPENKERYIVERPEEERLKMLEQRDFRVFKEKAVSNALHFTRKVALDGQTLEPVITKAELAIAIRKQLKRRVEEKDIKLQHGATTINAMGEAKVRVYVDVPELMRGDKEPSDKKRVTEGVDVSVTISRDETKSKKALGGEVSPEVSEAV